jgi:hypothetical protein
MAVLPVVAGVGGFTRLPGCNRGRYAGGASPNNAHPLRTTDSETPVRRAPRRERRGATGFAGSRLNIGWRRAWEAPGQFRLVAWVEDLRLT